MDKGIKQEIVDRILEDCERVGINVNLQTMIGFLTETITEALETLSYLRDHKHHVASFSMGHFRLIGNTTITESPMGYGLSDLKHDGYGSLFSYKANVGLLAEDAEILADVLYSNLLNDYPVNTFFLDGPMGAQALHYASRSNLRDTIATGSTTTVEV